MLSCEIPLYIIAIKEDGYHVFLEVKINGHKVFMLLDTGASRTVFDMKTIKKIHEGIEMEENEEKATGLGSDSVENYVAEISTIKIGDIEVKNYESGIVDLTHVNESYKKIGIPSIAGVLGSDLLMRFDAVIYYKKKILKLYKK